MSTVEDKARELQRLHADPELLVLVNVWDVITAKVVADTPGTTALATASHSIAAAYGYPDGELIPRDLMIEAVGRIAAAVDLPVTADLEAGYGDAGRDGPPGHRRRHRRREPRGPAQAAARRRARGRGTPSRRASGPACRSCSTRAPTPSCGPASRTPPTVLADAIERGRAYLDAGASTFFAPGLLDEATVTALVDALGRRR